MAHQTTWLSFSPLHFWSKILAVKHSKIRKLGKINKYEFISNIANSELIGAPYKTASVLSDQYFHILRNLLDQHTSIHEHKTERHVNKGLINSEILAAMRLKHKLKREWRRDNSTLNCSRCRASVNHFNRLLECAKSKCYSNMIRELRIYPRPCGIP